MSKQLGLHQLRRSDVTEKTKVGQRRLQYSETTGTGQGGNVLIYGQMYIITYYERPKLYDKVWYAMS